MTEYVTQLENQIDTLQERIATLEPIWEDGPNKDQRLLKFGNCIIANIYSNSSETGWCAAVYGTLGAIDQCESYTAINREECIEWIYKTLNIPK